MGLKGKRRNNFISAIKKSPSVKTLKVLDVDNDMYQEIQPFMKNKNASCNVLNRESRKKLEIK